MASSLGSGWDALPSDAENIELLNVVGDMGAYFQVPGPAAISRPAADTGSCVLTVQWGDEGPKRILQRTIRPVELSFPAKKSDPATANIADDDDVAFGVVYSPPSSSDEIAGKRWVCLCSVSDTSGFDDSSAENARGVVFTALLTRTRWCTKIRSELMASIVAQHVD
jgi:hypothetical protein